MEDEESKLYRKKEKAKSNNDKEETARCCNKLAKFYYKNWRLDDALKEYEQEADIWKEMDNKNEWGSCNRMIADIYFNMDKYDKAIEFEKNHLAAARELNDERMEQRALCNIGRFYLVQGETFSDVEEAKIISLKAAGRTFMESFMLWNRLNSNSSSQVRQRELMDMKARLILNIGSVHMFLGYIDEALNDMHKAKAMCKTNKLQEILHLSLTTEAALYADQKKDYQQALILLEEASSLVNEMNSDDKVLKQCRTLLAKADILCSLAYYELAMLVLLHAWLLQTPNDKERKEIESKLKYVVAMCEKLKILQNSTVRNDTMMLKKLYEDLGDGASCLENYDDAIGYYEKMLRLVENTGESNRDELKAVYVSLYQTYKDMGRYEKALIYCEKEYELMKDNPKEACATLLNLVNILHLLKKPYLQLEEACNKARCAALNANDILTEKIILETLLKYQEDFFLWDKVDETKENLIQTLEKIESLGLNIDNNDSVEENSQNVGHDIDESRLKSLASLYYKKGNETKRQSPKIGRYSDVKKKIKEEKPLYPACWQSDRDAVQAVVTEYRSLHKACSLGHYEIVRILLDLGADVNDNRGGYGITPLHIAAGNGHLTVVQLLLDRGAVPSPVDNSGKTPLQLLQKWKAEINKTLTEDQQILYDEIHCRIYKVDTANVYSETTNSQEEPTPGTSGRMADIPSDNYDSLDDDQPRPKKYRPSNDMDDSEDNLTSNYNNNNEVLGRDQVKMESDIPAQSPESDRLSNNNLPTSTCNHSPRFLQTTSKQWLVNVKVRDILIGIFFTQYEMRKYSLNWLITEALNRYNEAAGEMPSFKCLMLKNDGMLLSKNDPLSVILCLTEQQLKDGFIIKT